MPNIIAVLRRIIWVFNPSWVPTRDKVCDVASCSRRSMPQDLSWATIVHGRGPDSQDCVLRHEGTIIEQSLMLSHSVVQGDVIVFTPSSKGMKEQDWILEAFGEELLACIIEHENVTVVKWVSNLESIDSVSTSIDDGLVHLCGRHSVLIHAIIELDILQEMHLFSRDEEITLRQDSFYFRMSLSECSKNAC